MVRVAVASTTGEIERLRPAWERLQDGPATMFQTYAWNWAAAKIFGRREAPFVVYAESDSGAALIPAAVAVERREITLLGEEMFDYRDILTAGDPEVQRVAWEYLARLAATAVGADYPRRAGTPVVGRPSRRNSSAMLPGSLPPTRQRATGGGTSAPGALLAAGPARRSRVARARRIGVHVGAVDIPAQGVAARALFRDLFRDELRVEFMVSVAAAVGSACRIFTLEMGGRG